MKNLPKVIFIACMIGTIGQAYAAMHNASIALATRQKKAVRNNSMAQLVFSNDEANQAFKQLCREIATKCYFGCRKAEKAVCANCCGSSKFIVSKEGIRKQVIHHYSCCCAYKAMQLVDEDSKLFFSENKDVASHFTVNQEYQLPTLCCCIGQARTTITCPMYLILPPPAKPAAVDAKRD